MKSKAKNILKKSKKKMKPLRSISAIRRFFYRNETPMYFISPTCFNLLGVDEWIKGFRFISYIDCFDSQHPNLFVPKEIPHDVFQSVEDINNYLLEHPDVQEYIKKRGSGGKVMFLMFDERTEELAEKLGLEVIFPPAKLREHLDNKMTTTRIAEKAGVPCVPNVMAKVKSFEELRKISEKLGNDLVIQSAFGDSGHTTFFISNEDDWNEYADEIVNELEVKIMKRIKCRGSAIEACVTKHGTVVAPLMTELVGFPELTPYKGGWCGNEVFADAFSEEIRLIARKATQAFGDELRNEGYKGYFELDFLYDEDNGELYLGEMNPRVTGASSITNHAVFALADIPLFLFHILEWADVSYHVNIDQVNKRWADHDYHDRWGQLVIKHTEDTLEMVTEAPQSGIWRIDDGGEISFDRYDVHRRAVESESEAFFLRINNVGDYCYEGADLGILITRGRLMADDFQLNDRAKTWIKEIRKHFKSKPIDQNEELPVEPTGFKML